MRPLMGAGLAIVGAGLAWLITRLPGCRQKQRDASAVLFLTAVVALFFWPVLLASYTFPKGGGDLWGQLYPVWAFVSTQVRRGVFPLWDPLLAAGDPILSEGQYGLFNPLNWPLFLLSPPSVEAVLLRGMTGVLLAGVGMYLYLTRSPRLRLTIPAGLVGGVAYMLSDPLIVHLGHPQINDAIAWLPWSLLGLDWALAAPSWRRAALGGVPLALTVLAGHGQASLYGLIAAGAYGLWAALVPVGRSRELPLPLRIGRVALAGLVGFALSAPMTLPGIERLPWTVRSLMPRELRRGSDPGWFRVDTDPTARHLWSPEALQVQGFETLQGSGDPLALYSLEQFYWSLPSKTSAGYRLLGIKYIIVSKGEPPGGEGIWPVFIEDETVDIHLNTLALPRVWLVYRTEPVEDFGEAFRHVLSPDFRPEEVAVVENGPRLEGEGSGTIEVARYSPNEVIFVVHTDTHTLLVLSDVYYPGWHADLDGEPVSIYRTDATFRGVLVPPGDHRVRMQFFPRSLQAGLGLAAVALVFLAHPGRIQHDSQSRRGT